MEWLVEHFLFNKWHQQLWSKVNGAEVLEIGVGKRAGSRAEVKKHRSPDCS